MKTVFALWPEERLEPSERRIRLLEAATPEILALPVKSLVIDVDDDFSTVKSPAPKWYKGDPLVGLVSVTAEAPCDEQIRSILAGVGFKVGVYRVEGSVYKDYGDNQHFRKRDWPDGERSPVELAVTLLTRPEKLPHTQWIRRWHGAMSPVSEKLQPRARYVRNVVLECVGDSPAFDGIVEEAWPSARHITDPYLFYCANNWFQLISHIAQMLFVITRFHRLHKIRTVTMSEYFIKTP